MDIAQGLRHDVAHDARRKEPPRVLIVWDWIPCLETGAGIILRRLFDGYPPEKLWLLTSAASARKVKFLDPIPERNHQRTVFQASLPYRFVSPLVSLVNLLLIPVVVWRGVKFVRKNSIDALFGVPWNTFFISAYFIHKTTGCPLHVYVMDDPVGKRATHFFKAPLYRILMPKILRSAKTVWGVSRYMCESFERRYAVPCQTLFPLLDVEKFRHACGTSRKPPDDRVEIVYTGAIYTAQLDALKNLVRVLSNGSDASRETGRGFALTLFTSLPEPTLRRMGLMGPGVRRGYVKVSEIPRVLAEADILFLPLSFAPEMRHIVETSLPTKIAEYLASGVPILVHAPLYASVARYCREHKFGVLVDEPDGEKLLDALVRLATNTKLKQELTATAMEVAKRYHDRSRIVSEFLEQVSS